MNEGCRKVRSLRARFRAGAEVLRSAAKRPLRSFRRPASDRESRRSFRRWRAEPMVEGSRVVLRQRYADI